MKNWLGVAFGIAGGLLGAGLIYLMASQPRGQPIELRPPPTAPPLVVHISGAVANPGVYFLPLGCRVHEALQAAGGLSSEADAGALNLAASVEDGERIWVPARQLEKTQAPSRSGAIPTPIDEFETAPTSTPSGPININTATQAELESLPKIGPVIAQRIIDYRTENGPFTKIEDLQEVSGIGPAIFEQVKDLITIAGP